MEGRSRHCPHLGLKHTRSIRFASPTPEHRCYIFGDPLSIEVDQRAYCLGERYPECPRFAGMEAPPAGGAAAQRGERRPSALALFWRGLGRRDRALYLSLIGLLLVILAAYALIIGVILPARDRAMTPTPTAPTATVPPADTLPPVIPTTVLPTRAPTVPTTVPTAEPPVTPFPTTVVPSVTPVPPTATVPPPTATPFVPTATVPPVVPTATPVPATMWSTLYFLGPNKAYYVPVNRESGPWTEGVARRALELMADGPRAGTVLLRSIPAGMQLRDVYREGGTLYVDFDRAFGELGAGRAEAMAVVLAMTEFSTVERVQFMVNGQPAGLPGSGNTEPVGRPQYVNLEDPYGVDPGNATNLTLYFATPDGRYLFPIVRRVPFTMGVARAAIEEMIKGPSGSYQGVAVALLPADTKINAIDRQGNTIVVDFNSAFLQAANRDLAVKSLIFAVTDLTADTPLGVTALRISVDGQDLGNFWGGGYSGNLARSLLNPEGR